MTIESFWTRIDPDNKITSAERVFTNALADQIAANDSMWIGVLDHDPDALLLAGETIGEYRVAVGFGYPDYGISPHHAGTAIGEHVGPQCDIRNVTTMNRLYGILAGKPDELIPLSYEYTWLHVAAQRLKNYRNCNVRISVQCEKHAANVRFAVKSGEFVPIYATCRPCRDWFDLENFDRRIEQNRLLINLDKPRDW